MTPTTSLALLVSALGQAFLLASGEIFHLDKKPIPAAYSLQGLVAFTVYVPPDGPKANAGDSPFVEFKGVQAYSTDPGKADVDLESYGSVQLSLVSMDDYDAYKYYDKYCGSDGRLRSFRDSKLTYTVGFTKTHFNHSDINKTGTYVLLMSNCGNVSQGEVSGQVAVRNPFGFMSGTQYHKFSFYGCTMMFYMVLSVTWGALCMSERQELTAIHAMVGSVIGLKLMECASWTVHLNTINMSGNASDVIVCMLVMFTTLTSYTAYAFILVMSQSWRMADYVLEDCMLVKMGFFGLIWVVINYVREGALVNRQSFYISTAFMTMTAASSMITNAAVSGWVLLSLAKLSKSLKERSLDDQHRAISHFTLALVVAIVASAAVAFLQLLDSMGSLQLAWEHQYLADGGVSQVAFAFVVVVAMRVWTPSAGSGQLGYTTPVGQDEEDDPWKGSGVPVASTEASADEDAEHTRGSTIAPATVGVAGVDLR